MPEPKRSPQQIGEHFRAAYQSVSGKLHEWEQAKAALLVGVGRECLQLVRETLEPLPDHDLTQRKAERARLVKEIETALPADCEGIGVPQVNRWIRWAGACEVLAVADDLTVPWGLKQTHLMVVERFIEHNEARCEFRLKPSWKNALAGMQSAIQSCVQNSWSANELDAALDRTAEPESQHNSLPISMVSESGREPALSDPQPTPELSTHSAPVSTATVPRPAQAQVRPTDSPSPAASPSPGPTRTTAPAPESQGSTGPTPQNLADQAFQLLQRDEILAGVFRREWDAAKVLSLVDNLIRGCGEDSSNLLGLARAYHRLRPFVLTFFDEYCDENKFKLKKKERPEPPTLEQLAPLGELQTA